MLVLDDPEAYLDSWEGDLRSLKFGDQGWTSKESMGRKTPRNRRNRKNRGTQGRDDDIL